jgi:hypothetical protein
MADEADQSDNEIEAHRALGIEQARRAQALKPKHACHFCDEAVLDERLFCGPECREDFEAQARQMKRAGR